MPILNRNRLFGVKYDAINAEEVKKQITDEAALAVLDKDLTQVGRSTLRVAAVLPSIMAISFLLIMIWYRSQGGYKPVHLVHEEDA